MKAAKLRQSILQAAVQGKLVPQDPNDEPASELLKRIQQEKARLIKEGKIKKEKPLPPISEDEIPYDLPEGWAWCRFQDIASFFNGDRSKNYPKKAEYVSSGIPWINTGHILPNGTLTQKGMNYISEEKYLSLSGGKIKPSDLVFCLRGATFGKVAKVVPYSYGAVASSLVIIRTSQLIDVDYLLYLLKSPYATAELRKYDNGSAQPNLAAKDVAKYCIPLPPQNEQSRIVTKINELLALCDELEAEEEKLNALEAHFTEYLPKAILQAAIQGKLVSPNSHDEPASELLKRIQQEKAQLVKEGKLKKGKPLPPISEDEIPYNLPKGWVWCRLCDIGQIVGGATPDSHESSYYTKPGQGIAWLTPADMTRYTKNNYISHGAKDITQTGYNSCSTTLMPPGSIIFSSRAPIGHIAFSSKEVCTNQGFKSVVPHITAVAPWIFYVLKSKVDDIQSRASGTTFKEVSGKFMESEIIPLPPLAEQQRIVAKVDELMALCEKLKAAYTAPIPLDKTDHIIPFPAAKKGEKTLLAARGDVGQLSNEAIQAFDDLFAGDEE